MLHPPDVTSVICLDLLICLFSFVVDFILHWLLVFPSCQHALVDKKVFLLEYVDSMYAPISKMYENQKQMMDDLGGENDQQIATNVTNTLQVTLSLPPSLALPPALPPSLPPSETFPTTTPIRRPLLTLRNG